MVKKTALFFLKWICVFWVVSVIAFMCPRLMPENPAESLLESHQLDPTPENIAKIEAAWGLDRPLPVQYIKWIGHFVKGDWGKSLISGVDIRAMFLRKLPYSILLGAGGLILSSILAYFLGFGAALKENGICDFISRGLTLFVLSVPSFVLVVVVVYFFGVKSGLIKFFTGDGRASMAIGIAIMTLYTLGPTSRVIKTHFREQMTAPYVSFAISRGFDEKYVLFRHAWKPAVCGLLSITIYKIPAVFGGSSILEFAMGIPGISSFLIDSMHATDYYVLQSYIMVLIICVFTMHFLLNLVLEALEVKNK